ERSCSVAYALASTVGSRVAGFVTKWPSLIFEVSRAATASIGIDSCQRTCESYVHAYWNPCFSASWISSSQRENGGSGRTVTPNSIARAYRGAAPLGDSGHAPPSHVRCQAPDMSKADTPANEATSQNGRQFGHAPLSHVRCLAPDV